MAISALRENIQRVRRNVCALQDTFDGLNAPRARRSAQKVLLDGEIRSPQGVLRLADMLASHALVVEEALELEGSFDGIVGGFEAIAQDVAALETQFEGLKWAEGLPKDIQAQLRAAKLEVTELKRQLTEMQGHAQAGSVIQDPIALRDQVRSIKEPLLFTRNISLGREFQAIVKDGMLSPNGRGCLHLRNGIGTEYGKEGDVLTIIFKKSLWEAEKDKADFRNIFVSQLDGQDVDQTIIMPVDTRENLLIQLREKVEYHRGLQTSGKAMQIGMDDSVCGMSIIHEDLSKYMGVFPQLEISHDILLDQVETILVPEHLYDAACEIARGNPQVLRLLQKVEGTGETKDKFLEGRKNMPRRSRAWFGRYKPNFGDEAFYLFEQAYFRVVLEGRPTDSVNLSFETQVRQLVSSHFTIDPFFGWLMLRPTTGQKIDRQRDSDWKVFVNPRPDEFFNVLRVVCSVLGNRGIEFKVPADINAFWRSGRTFGDSASPKIVVYANSQTLPEIIKDLDAALKQECSGAGFSAAEKGPSFCRRVPDSEFLSYKIESFRDDGEVRKAIADAAKREAINDGVTDKREIKRRQQAALEQAGFVGENFYMQQGDIDPILGATPQPAKEPADPALQAERRRVKDLEKELTEAKLQGVGKELVDQQLRTANGEITTLKQQLEKEKQRADVAEAREKVLHTNLAKIQGDLAQRDKTIEARDAELVQLRAELAQEKAKAEQAEAALEAAKQAPPSQTPEQRIAEQLGLLVNDAVAKSSAATARVCLDIWACWDDCMDRGETPPSVERKLEIQQLLLDKLEAADKTDFTEEQRDAIVAFLENAPADKRRILTNKYRVAS